MNGRNAMVASLLVLVLGPPLAAQETHQKTPSRLTVERIYQAPRIRR